MNAVYANIFIFIYSLLFYLISVSMWLNTVEKNLKFNTYQHVLYVL
jgi:hypothetical protein